MKKILFIMLLFVTGPSFATDVDGDGLIAGRELCNGNYVPYSYSGSCDSQAACDANPDCGDTLDYDCDGISDFDEWGSGNGSDPTDPYDPATPLDSDNDGIFNSCDDDADNDGVLDVSDNCPVFWYNPDQLDTDGDLTGDACETDIDTDGDGIMNAYEKNTGVYVSATDTGTDPLLADTDGDGLNDGYETNTGTYVDANNTGTDPNKDADADDDGISDAVEVLEEGTDPFLVDTDGDGVNDLADAYPTDRSQIIAVSGCSCVVADLNTDGAVTTADLVLLQQHLITGATIPACQ